MKADEREHLFEQIIQSLDEMPEKLRQVFVLRHYSGSTSTEIARQVNIRETDVADLLRQAEQLFYRGLEDFRT